VKTSYFESNVYGDRVDYVPSSIEEMFQYNLVVIGNIDYEAIGEDFTAYLKYFVEHGGSLLVLGGDFAFGHGGYAGTPFEDLLPIKCGGPFDLKEAVAGASLIVPGEGSLAEEGKGNPCATYLHVPAEVKPGATVVTLAGAAPFCVAWKLGDGAVAVLLGAPLGEPAEGVAFWQWERWPHLLEATLEGITFRRQGGPPAALPPAVPAPPGAAGPVK
jgi:uncharacterized membrane protein